jgi:hypothetical protein
VPACAWDALGRLKGECHTGAGHLFRTAEETNDLQEEVTGGTGHLGRAIVARLADDGQQARVLARQPGNDPDVEWVRGDLATGAGVTEAIAGIDAVIHAATNSPAAQRGGFRPLNFVRSPTDVDVDGTTLC